MAHETIVLEAALVDYAPSLVAKNPFRDKKKKGVGTLGWRGSSAPTSGSGNKAQFPDPHVGKVQVRDPITNSLSRGSYACSPTYLLQLVVKRPSDEDSSSTLPGDASTYWLRFLNVRVRNEKDLPAFVLLSRSHARDLNADKSVLKQLEVNAETILLDCGPDGGQWKGCHMSSTFDQELSVFDPLSFGSVVICKPSAAKPPSILPLVFVYGAFQSYAPPQKSQEQIALEMEALSNKLLSTVMEIDQSELQGQEELSLDELQRNAKQLFKMFDQDKSNSIDFEGLLRLS